MARYREVPCKFYIALGQCKKGRQAIHRTYCQHCDKYEPRVKVKSLNRKKQGLDRGRMKDRLKAEE